MADTVAFMGVRFGDSRLWAICCSYEWPVQFTERQVLMSEFKSQTAENLTQRPFAERQLLVVSTDAVLRAAERIASETSTKKAHDNDWSGLALSALKSIRGWEASVGKMLGIAAIEAYKSLRSAWDKGLPIQTNRSRRLASLISPQVTRGSIRCMRVIRPIRSRIIRWLIFIG